MAVSRQNVTQTLEEVITWRPVLAPVLRAFEPLLAAQEALVEPLAASLAQAGLALPRAQAQRLEQGLSLLAGASFGGVAPVLRESATALLPILCRMDAVTPHKKALSEFFLREASMDAEAPADNDASTGNGTLSRVEQAEALTAAVASGDRETLLRLAEDAGLDPMVLHFTAGIIVAPVLRALAAQAVNGEEQEPWDQGDVWRQGYCPVCGALPTIGWLDKPVVDEKNAFLAGGGGKKHLHCGVCGANWKFRRGACPACGEEGSGVMELLRESGNAHGERLDWCTKCRSYCPSVDLREREFVPNLDALALGMMHLDMVAARKKLKPLMPSFWNMF